MTRRLNSRPNKRGHSRIAGHQINADTNQAKHMAKIAFLRVRF